MHRPSSVGGAVHIATFGRKLKSTKGKLFGVEPPVSGQEGHFCAVTFLERTAFDLMGLGG